MVRRRTRTTIAAAQRLQVQPVNHFNDKPRQMPLRQPIIHRRRQQKPVCRSTSRKLLIPPTDPGVQARSTLPHYGHLCLKSDRLLAGRDRAALAVEDVASAERIPAPFINSALGRVFSRLDGSHRDRRWFGLDPHRAANSRREIVVEPMVCGLTAGGRRIRTVSPSRESGPSYP